MVRSFPLYFVGDISVAFRVRQHFPTRVYPFIFFFFNHLRELVRILL